MQLVSIMMLRLLHVRCVSFLTPTNQICSPTSQWEDRQTQRCRLKQRSVQRKMKSICLITLQHGARTPCSEAADIKESVRLHTPRLCGPVTPPARQTDSDWFIFFFFSSFSKTESKNANVTRCKTQGWAHLLMLLAGKQSWQNIN